MGPFLLFPLDSLKNFWKKLFNSSKEQTITDRWTDGHNFIGFMVFLKFRNVVGALYYKIHVISVSAVS